MIATHLGTDAARSHVCRHAAVTQLIYRNDDLEAEKYGLIEENNALAAENAKLRLEAQAHAQEARTQRSTVHEIYQILSEDTGEPGDWNGAEPARKAFKALQADNRELRRQLAQQHGEVA